MANMLRQIRVKKTIANAPKKIYAKKNTMVDCVKADTMVVYARADAIKESATENLQRGICNRKFAKRKSVEESK